MARNLKNQVFEQVEIADLAAEGRTVTRIDNFVVFINNKVIPGDVADIKVTRQKRNYLEAIPVKFHKFSEKRAEPFCSHFGVCGGCKWQNLKYVEQLKYKEQQVKDSLTRIGKVMYTAINPIIPAEQTEFYRNKLEFTFSNKRWLTPEEVREGAEITNRNALGFHIPGMFDKVLNIDKCYLQAGLSNEIRLAISRFANENHLPFFDISEQEGFLRNLIIRNTTTGEHMVILSFYENKKKEIHKTLEFLKYKFPEITSLMYAINPKGNDTINDLEIKVYYGKDHIIEQLNGLKFKIGPKSFFQTNTYQAKKLYDVVKDFAGLSGDENVYDLYTGTGTIANYLAKDAYIVTGIDNVEAAVEDAKVNSLLNNITNTRFMAGDIKDVFSIEFLTKNGKPDVIVLDPPRAGVHKKVIDNIIFALPRKIIYISCNPATQARDVQLLSQRYEVVQVQPVDMFPHTHHVENVILMEKY